MSVWWGWRTSHLNQDIVSLGLWATILLTGVLLGTGMFPYGKTKLKGNHLGTSATLLLWGSLSQPQDLSRSLKLFFYPPPISLHTVSPQPSTHQIQRLPYSHFQADMTLSAQHLLWAEGTRCPQENLSLYVKLIQYIFWVSHGQRGAEPCNTKQGTKCQFTKERLWAEQTLSQDPTCFFPMLSILWLASLSQQLCEPATTACKATSSSLWEPTTDFYHHLTLHSNLYTYFRLLFL